MSGEPATTMAASKRERALLPLCLAVLVDMLGLGISIPVLAVILFQDSGLLPADAPIGLRTFTYGLLLACYPVAQFFGAPLLGALSDRFGRKPLLLLSLIGTSIGFCLFAAGVHWTRLSLLFLSRVLDGFTGGNLSIAVAAVADLSDARRKSRNFGLIGMAYGLGFILGPFLGGKLTDATLIPGATQTTPFLFAAALTLLNLILVAGVVPETLVTRRHVPIRPLQGVRNVRRALRLRHLRAILLTVTLTTLSTNFFTQFFNVFLVEKFAFDARQIGDLFGYAAVWIAVSQGVLLKPLTDRFPLTRVFSVTTLIMSLGIPLLLLPDRPIGIYLILPLIAVAAGLSDATGTSVVSGVSGEDEQGEILGIKQSLQSLAAAIPPVIAGLVASVHLSLPIWGAALSGLAGWLLFRLQFHEHAQANRRTE